MRRMGAAEFDAWRVYANLAPIGEARADWRTGILAATIVNVVGQAAGGDPQATPQQFMPFLPQQDDDEETEMSAEETFATLLGAFAGR